MKDEKKVNKAEEVKEDIKTEEKGTPLTDEEMASVTAGKEFAGNQEAQGDVIIPTFEAEILDCNK